MSPATRSRRRPLPAAVPPPRKGAAHSRAAQGSKVCAAHRSVQREQAGCCRAALSKLALDLTPVSLAFRDLVPLSFT
eukprot:scaffold3768_cov376-Prasinococcus_capsulatus_cf.AAC.31